MHYAEDEQAPAFGSIFAQKRPVSEETARLIDEETRRIVEEAEAQARAILSEHAADLKTLADALLEHETLSGDDVEKVLRGEKVTGARLGARAVSLTPDAGLAASAEATVEEAPQTA